MKNLLYRLLIVLTAILFFSLGMLSVCQAVQPVQKHGILDKTAPELTCEYWVNGKGESVKKVLLSDYRGKVIYLLFFQDW